jgi:hypothetical protein
MSTLLRRLPLRMQQRVSRERRRTWVLAFLGFFLITTAWSIASPMGSSPDEPAHLVKAAATARLEITPDHVRLEHTNGWAKYWLAFKLPANYATLDGQSSCYRGDPVASAACAKPFSGDTHTTLVETSAGQNNPIYYFPVGLPSLVSEGRAGLYGMRIASSALCALFLASALLTAYEWKRRRAWPMLAVFACGTPMALFLCGSVNPNGLEAVTAVLAWIAALSLVLDPDPALVGRRATRLAVAGVFLLNTRSIGPEWLTAVVSVALVAGGWRIVRELSRTTAMRVCAGVLVVGAVAAEAWQRYAESIAPSSALLPLFAKMNAHGVALEAMQRSSRYLDETIGLLGWEDTSLPPGVHYTWFAVLGLMVLLALSVGRIRDGVLLIALILGGFLIPIAAQVLEYRTMGISWQGRYGLAFVAGIPILAGTVLAAHGREFPRSLEFRAPIVAASFLAFADVLAFYWPMIRYGKKIKTSLLPTGMNWAPPGGWPASWALYLGGLAAVVGLFVVAGRHGVPTEPVHGDPDPGDLESADPAEYEGAFTMPASRRGAPVVQG